MHGRDAHATFRRRLLSRICPGRAFLLGFGARMKLGAVLALLVFLAGCKREAPAPPPTTAPATQASTKPAKPAPTTSYVDVIRAAYPKMPATQPLGVPV